jgi:site-specific recombinase XerD
LFESSWKKPYSDRGVRKILARYTQGAGITASISPRTLRHFLFTWLKTQGIDDALIQPYSGHATRQSLEIYSRLALADAPARLKVLHQELTASTPDTSGISSGSSGFAVHWNLSAVRYHPLPGDGRPDHGM